MATFWFAMFLKQYLIYTWHLFTPRKKIGRIKDFNLSCFCLNLCFLNVSIPFINISEPIVKVKLILDVDRCGI